MQNVCVCAGVWCTGPYPTGGVVFNDAAIVLNQKWQQLQA